jgi:leucyl-tRNA synthetase
VADSGQQKTLAYEPWPAVNEEYLVEESFEYPVSFNGKLRFKLELPLSTPRPVPLKEIILIRSAISKMA